MARKLKTIMLVGLLAIICGALIGCESDAQTGTAIGAGLGAIGGQIIGGDTEGTVIGTAVGAGAGYMIGNESDKKKAAQDRAAIRNEMNTVTVYVKNSNGSVIPVTLRKSGPGFYGPRNEYYPSMPSEEDLRMIYGF